ncbi:hypothetical protein Gotur_022403 [Gossypium turneri]
MWQMFGGIVATGENASAPSSGVLPSGAPMGDDTPNEGLGDSDEHRNENEGIPPNEAPSNPSHETPNLRKKTLRVVHMNEIIFPHSQYTISNAMDAFCALGDEIPKKKKD